MSEEWTGWKDHDGKGVPAELKVGMILEAEQQRRTGGPFVTSGVVTSEILCSERWCETTIHGIRALIIRYRIRKPRTLQAMIERAAALSGVKHLEKVQ